jgi:tetratricopeptide (TPR) repeat protein
LLRNGEYSQIEYYYQQAIALDSKNETAYDIMATALYQQNKNTEAIAFLEDAIVKFPANNDLRLKLATAYFKEEKSVEGLEQLKILEASEPNNPKVVLKMAMVYEQQKDWDNALSSYQKASGLDNKSIQASGGTARILEQKQDYFRAIVAYRRFIELAPENPYGYHRLGLLLKDRGRKPEAKEMLEKAKSIYQQQGKLEKVAEVQKEI